MSNEIGARVRQVREAEGLNQRDFAARLEISSGGISQIESGKAMPGGDFLLKINQVYAVDITWLLTGMSAVVAPPHAQARIDESLMLAVLRMLKNAAKAAGKRWTDDALMRAAIQTYNDLADSDTGETQLEEKIRLVINNR